MSRIAPSKLLMSSVKQERNNRHAFGQMTRAFLQIMAPSRYMLRMERANFKKGQPQPTMAGSTVNLKFGDSRIQDSPLQMEYVPVGGVPPISLSVLAVHCNTVLEMKSAFSKTKIISYPMTWWKNIFPKSNWQKKWNTTSFVSEEVRYKKGGVSIFQPVILQKDTFCHFIW